YTIASSTNWDTAFSWGNHALAGYLTAESDPVWISEKASYLTTSGNGGSLTGLTKTQVGLGNVDNYASTSLEVLSASKWTTARSFTTSGDVVVTSAAWDGSGNFTSPATIQNSAVTLAKMADLDYGNIIGRSTNSTGAPEAISTSTYKTMLALIKDDVGLANVANTAQVTSVTASGLLSSSGGITPAITMPLTAGYTIVGDNSGIASATSTLYISPDNGNVGIGTTTSTYPLAVTKAVSTGIIYAEGSVAGSKGLVWTHSDPSALKWSLTSGISGISHTAMAINDGTDNILTIQGATNRVGINDTTPSYDLDVNGTFNTGTTTINGQVTMTPVPNNGGAGSPNNGYNLMLSSFAPNLYFNDMTTTESDYAINVNTGIFKISQASSTDFTSLTDVFVIDASGEIGIGTASPYGALHLKTASTSRAILAGDVQNGNSPKLSFFGNMPASTYILGPSIQKVGSTAYGAGDLVFWQHPTGDYTTENEAMRITSTGLVGVGTTGPLSKLHVTTSNTDGFYSTTTSYGTGGTLYNYGEDATYNYSMIALGDKADLTSTATKYWAITNRKATQNDAFWIYYNDKTQASNLGTVWFRIASSTGAITLDGHKSCTSGIKSDANGLLSCVTSDERLKKDIEPMLPALDKLMEFKPSTYYWRDPASGLEKNYGLIAQDVQKVIPDLVFNFKQGDQELLGINWNGVISVMLKSVQELAVQLRDLAARVTGHDDQIKALQDKNAALEARLSALEAKEGVIPPAPITPVIVPPFDPPATGGDQTGYGTTGSTETGYGTTDGAN
ncbi:MAG: tail fiber domain-containing protein, partial [Candidatus Paceibacterota bacterium]